MVGREHGGNSPAEIEQWELDLIAEAARKIEPLDHQELTAELARQLLLLKRQRRADIRDWRAYLATFLHNRIRNWIRDRRVREKRKSTLDESAENIGENFLFPARGPTSMNDDDQRLAFGQAWQEMEPELRRFWRILLEEDGNQAAVARRTGKHRNTVILWIKRIRAILIRHGFDY